MDLSMLTSPQQKMALEIIRQCAKSRVWFVQNVLKVEHIEDWQMDVLVALDNGETRISIRSGHGVGKTALCSWLNIHFVLFRDDVKVVVTAPSLGQMKDGLIPETSKWIAKLPEWMRLNLIITSDRITRSPDNSNNFVSFRTGRAENPEALQGIHATFVMILVDEASGVAENVYEAGSGSLSTEGAIVVLISNPTKPSGYFFKTHTILAHLWKTVRVSCFDSSRVSPEYIKIQEKTYGISSREYKVRVLGEFPDSGANAVIPRDYVQSAVDRGPDIYPMGERVWGIDPGRGGDPSGFIDRVDNYIYEVAEYKYDDSMRLVGAIKTRWDQTPSRHRPVAIYIDCIGMGGPISDRLLELNMPVIQVNVADAAAENDRFHRLRDELCYTTRDWFERRKVGISPDIDRELVEKFVEELAAIEEDEPMSNGQVKIESKKKMRARGVASPNMADSLFVTMSNEGAIINGMHSTKGWDDVNVDKYRPANVI